MVGFVSLFSADVQQRILRKDLILLRQWATLMQSLQKLLLKLPLYQSSLAQPQPHSSPRTPPSDPRWCPPPLWSSIMSRVLRFKCSSLSSLQPSPLSLVLLSPPAPLSCPAPTLTRPVGWRIPKGQFQIHRVLSTKRRLMGNRWIMGTALHIKILL